MTLTLSQLTDHVKHALGGDVSSQLPGGSSGIINEAGRYLFSLPWKFRERPPTDIAFVSSQTYADLPGDFGELIAANMKDGLVKSFTFTTFADLVQRRSTSTGATNHYWVAISHPVPQEGVEATAPLPPRLELYPTPTAADEMTIVYRGNWITLADDAEVALVPDYAESALVALVRAFALGYEEEGLETRLAEVETGPIWLRLLEKDGLVQPDYGPIRNGALSMIGQRHNLPWDSTSDPT